MSKIEFNFGSNIIIDDLSNYGIMGQAINYWAKKICGLNRFEIYNKKNLYVLHGTVLTPQTTKTFLIGSFTKEYLKNTLMHLELMRDENIKKEKDCILKIKIK